LASSPNTEKKTSSTNACVTRIGVERLPDQPKALIPSGYTHPSTVVGRAILSLGSRPVDCTA
jgi:hypothetical protein